MPLYGKIVIIKRTGVDGTTFPLMAQLCLFGRDHSCDIRVQLPNVSKKHCAIVVGDDGKVSVNAYNRTLINGVEVNGRTDINHKDIMTVSDRSFRFEYPPNSVFRTSTPSTPPPRTSSYLLGPSLETPKDTSPPKAPASAGRTPRPKAIALKPSRKSRVSSPAVKMGGKSNQNKKRQSESPKPETPATGTKKRKIIKSPKSVRQVNSRRKNVSFGPYLSPERFDLNLPANTPVKKGTTPRRVSEPPKYFGSPMVYSSGRVHQAKRKQSFNVTPILEERVTKSPASANRRKTLSPGMKNSPSPKTPSPKRKSLPLQVSPDKSIFSPGSSSMHLYLSSSSDVSTASTPRSRRSTPSPVKKVSKTPSPAKKASRTPSPAKKGLKTPSPAKKASRTPSPAKKGLKTPSPVKKVSKTPSPAKKVSKTPSPAKKVSKTPSPAKKGSRTPSPAKKSSISPSPVKKVSKTPSPAKKGSKTPSPVKKDLRTPSPVKMSPKTPRSSNKAQSSAKTTPGRKTTPRKVSPSPKASRKIPTPKSPDSKKIKALAAIHASKLNKSKAKTPIKKVTRKLATSMLKKGLPSRRTPKVAKKLVKLAINRKIAPVQKRKPLVRHVTTKVKTAEVNEKRSTLAKKKSLSVSAFKTPNVTTDVFVSPSSSANATKGGRNKGAMISRFIKDQAKKEGGKSPKSGPGYVDPTGIKRLMRTPGKTPNYTNVRGMKRLFGSRPSQTVDYSDVDGVDELLKSPERSGETSWRGNRVNTSLNKVSASPKPTTSTKSSRRSGGSDIQELLNSSRRSLNDEEIAQLFSSPSTSTSTSTSRTVSPVKTYPEGSSKRKSGRASASAYVRPIGIATPIRNSLNSPTLTALKVKNSPNTSKTRSKSTTPIKPSTSPVKALTRAHLRRSGSIGRQKAARDALDDIMSNIEDEVSPRRRKNLSPEKKSILPNTSKVIITQNSDPHDILEKTKVPEPAKLVVFYLVSPETIASTSTSTSAGPSASTSTSPGPSTSAGPSSSTSTSATPSASTSRRSKRSASPLPVSPPKKILISPANATPLKKAKPWESRSSRETTSTPIQQGKVKKTPTISPVLSPKTTRGSRSMSTKSPSTSYQQDIEDDISSIKKSPAITKKTVTRGRQAKAKKTARGKTVSINASDEDTTNISVVSTASSRSKTPSPPKKVTRGRSKKSELSSTSIATSHTKSPSPVRKTRSGAKTKRNASVDVSNSLQSDSVSQSPLKRATRTKKVIVSPKKLTPVKKATRGSGKKAATHSPKSESPVAAKKSTRGKAATKSPKKSPSPSKKSTTPKRGAGKKTATESPKSESPLVVRKTTRGKAAVKKQVSSPKKSPSPSPAKKATTPKRGARGNKKVVVFEASPSPTPPRRAKRRAQEVASQSPKKARTTRGGGRNLVDSTKEDTEDEEDLIEQLKKDKAKTSSRKTATKAAKKAPAKRKTTVKKKTGLSPVREEVSVNSDASGDGGKRKSPVKKAKKGQSPPKSPKAKRTLRSRK